MLQARFREAGIPHPAHAVCSGKVEALAGLDQHVQTHQQPEGIAPAIIVDDWVIHDQRATTGQRFVSLGDERSFPVDAPIVQDVSP